MSEPKNKRPSLVNVLEKRDVEKPLVSLVDLVRVALDQWASWAVHADHRQVLTGVQFLALVLWVICEENTSEPDEERIVEGWGEYVDLALNQKILVALDPVTFLPMPAGLKTVDWVITVNHANYFLEHMPAGFDCKAILAHWSKEAIAFDSQPLTYEFVVDLRKKNKGSRWEPQHVVVVLAEIKKREAAREKAVWKGVAKEFDLSVPTLRSGLAEKPTRGPAQALAQSSTRGNNIFGGDLIMASK